MAPARQGAAVHGRAATWCGDPDSGLTLVELAMVRADRLHTHERAMLLAERAKALAKLRRVQDAATAIGMADEEMTHVSTADYPTIYDATKHAGTTGGALYHLAASGRFVGDATHRLNTAVAGYTETRTRSRAMSGTKLASLTMATGDPVQAADIGSRALADAGQVRSHRMADELRELRALAQPHAGIPEADELRTRIGTVVATT